jgi:predicted PurR-regulated permease PerM
MHVDMRNANYGKDKDPRSSNWLLWLGIVILALWAVVIIIYEYASTAQVLEKIESKIIHVTTPIPKYDSATQSRLDQIEANRQMYHQHVDNFSNNELQNVLDSLFNTAD